MGKRCSSDEDQHILNSLLQGRLPIELEQPWIDHTRDSLSDSSQRHRSQIIGQVSSTNETFVQSEQRSLRNRRTLDLEEGGGNEEWQGLRANGGRLLGRRWTTG